MIRILPLVLLLAACGVDGAPVPPDSTPDARPTPGVTVSGTAEFGISRKF